VAKHLASTVWCTRLSTGAPYQTVQTVNKWMLKIGFMPGGGNNGVAMNISRKDARLLAKRINQCLDWTVKK
jgi:hypothetical protein